MAIPLPNKSAANAAAWLRKTLNISSESIITTEFEEQFRCTISISKRELVFEDESEETAFLLKWM